MSKGALGNTQRKPSTLDVEPTVQIVLCRHSSHFQQQLLPRAVSQGCCGGGGAELWSGR